MQRAQIVSPVDGVAIFDDSSEWIGKPVVLGERIMVVASPARTQLQIEVPASSVVSFDRGAEVVFFSNLRPDRPAYGKLTFASYSSTVAADGVMSYAFRASLEHASALRLGLKGTAKIYGPRRALVLWLLRRPLTVVREWLSGIGLQVPRDVGLIQLERRRGCENWAGMEQHNDLTGEAAVDMLVTLLHNNETGVPLFPRATLIGGSWMDGTTVRMANSSATI